MITPVSGVPLTQRLHRYSFQMLQAKLTSPVSPIRTYPLQELYSKQQAWASEIATTQSAVYETAKERKPDSSGTASSHWYSKTEEMQQNMHIFGSTASTSLEKIKQYEHSLLPSLFFSQAVHTGLFFNQLF